MIRKSMCTVSRVARNNLISRSDNVYHLATQLHLTVAQTTTYLRFIICSHAIGDRNVKVSAAFATAVKEFECKQNFFKKSTEVY